MHWLIIFIEFVETCIPGLFRRVCRVLEPKGVPGRESLPLPQGRRGFELHFLILEFFQAYPFSYSIISAAENIVLLGAATEELIESFFGLLFSGDLVYYLEEQ